MAGGEAPGRTPDVLRSLTVAAPFGPYRPARVSKRSRPGVLAGPRKYFLWIRKSFSRCYALQLATYRNGGLAKGVHLFCSLEGAANAPQRPIEPFAGGRRC